MASIIDGLLHRGKAIVTLIADNLHVDEHKIRKTVEEMANEGWLEFKGK